MSATFQTFNPYNNHPLQTYTRLSEAELMQSIDKAWMAFEQWSALTLRDRKDQVASAKLEMAKRRQELAQSMSREMGKPIQQAIMEVEKTLQLFDFCLTTADTALKEDSSPKFIVEKAPLGVIYGVMPWNFPVWQSVRFCLPAILAGNTILLKPAESVAGTGQLLHEIFKASLGTKHVFTNLLIDHDLSDKVIENRKVRGVSFTGSSNVGRHIGATAGKNLKKCVLELGGNDAYIVLEDADLKVAAQKVYQGRILNAGQSCISAKRVFVDRKIEKEFLELLQGQLQEISVGDPLLAKTTLGPLARNQYREQLQKQLDQAKKEGAKVHYQKDIPKELDGGSFFAPVILTQIPKGSSPHTEEFFGPIFSVISYATVDEAIEMANQSPYGLGGAVFSKDANKAMQVARRLDTGSIAINDYLKSAPDRPFGGVKDSGYGAELGPQGFLEFIHHKVITK